MSSYWSNMPLFVSPFDIALCVTEKQYIKAMKKAGIHKSEHDEWIINGADATCHYIEGQGSLKDFAILCIRLEKEPTPETVGLIAHECMHLWQWIKEKRRESNPSIELDAYAIQYLVMNIWAEYRRKAKKFKAKKLNRKKK